MARRYRLVAARPWLVDTMARSNRPEPASPKKSSTAPQPCAARLSTAELLFFSFCWRPPLGACVSSTQNSVGNFRRPDRHAVQASQVSQASHAPTQLMHWTFVLFLLALSTIGQSCEPPTPTHGIRVVRTALQYTFTTQEDHQASDETRHQKKRSKNQTSHILSLGLSEKAYTTFSAPSPFLPPPKQ
ncbi:hypothetical protein EV126DRAFT_199052 [Verticillium dahliae]|nr:hypothetical protein EV126DRAFT_199052 [Verticillium dahliae]